MTGIRAQIQAERMQGVPEPTAFETAMTQAQSRLGRAVSEVERAKAFSRKRKTEMEAWQAWYENLPDLEKPAGLVTLQNERQWRAAEIAENDRRIKELMQGQTNAMGVVGFMKQRMAAIEAGVDKLPLEQDPRLKSVAAELNKAVAEVARLEPQKPKRERQQKAAAKQKPKNPQRSGKSGQRR